MAAYGHRHLKVEEMNNLLKYALGLHCNDQLDE